MWFAIACHSTTVSVQNICSKRYGGHRIFGVSEMRKSYAARDGPATPFPEDKDDPCPVCRELSMGKVKSLRSQQLKLS